LFDKKVYNYCMSLFLMGLVVWSKVKKVVEMNVGEDVNVELEKKVEDILKKAQERARANGRRTVYARDL